MTREEAIEIISDMILDIEYPDGTYKQEYTEEESKRHLALYVAKKALRGPTREMVERMRGEWIRTHSTDNFWTKVWKCSYCGFEDGNGDCFDFCPSCGQPMTDEAVDIELRRWKEAFDEST